MPILTGTLLVLAVGPFTSAAGLDRDRALYPVVTLVVASCYALFAVDVGALPALAGESLGGAVDAARAAGIVWASMYAVSRNPIDLGFRGWCP